MASLGLLVRQMEIWYQCYTQHRLNFIFPSGSFSSHSHLPMAKQANVAALRILTLKRMANRTRRHKLQVLCVILISGSGLTLLPPPNINRPFDLLIFDVAI